jgi:hypothetical protein
MTERETERLESIMDDLEACVERIEGLLTPSGEGLQTVEERLEELEGAPGRRGRPPPDGAGNVLTNGGS